MPSQIGFSSPIGLDHLCNNNCPSIIDLSEPYPTSLPLEAIIVDRFRAKKKVLGGCHFHFTGPDRETGEVQEFTVPATSTSRYFEDGRQKIKRKLRNRLGTRQDPGCLLTLTCDPKRYSKIEAWENIWQEYAAFRRDLWKYLKRLGRAHSPLYVAVIEQHKSGYPHLHIVYPGLKYLAPKEVLKKCWRMGRARIDGSRRKGRRARSAPVLVNALSYVLKYVTKLAGWTEEGLAYLWHARVRLYNISPKLYAFPKAPKAQGWTLLKIDYIDEAIKDLARRLARLRLINHNLKRRRSLSIIGS